MREKMGAGRVRSCWQRVSREFLLCALSDIFHLPIFSVVKDLENIPPNLEVPFATGSAFQ